MARRRFRTFDEFWPYYVREHSNKVNQKLHLLGTTAALGLAATALATKRLRFLKWAFVAGYGPAWVGHFFVEKNRRATLRHPLWSLRGDLRMWRLALRGKLQAEVERIQSETEPPIDDGGKGYVHIADPNSETIDRDTMN
jgi:hypothetical protein